MTKPRMHAMDLDAPPPHRSGSQATKNSLPPRAATTAIPPLPRLITKPPLLPQQQPTSPSPSASTPSNAHTSSLSSVHKLLAQPHTNVNKNKRRYYEDDVSEDEPRYLDLSRHHPLPSHAHASRRLRLRLRLPLLLMPLSPTRPPPIPPPPTLPPTRPGHNAIYTPTSPPKPSTNSTNPNPSPGSNSASPKPRDRPRSRHYRVIFVGIGRLHVGGRMMGRGRAARATNARAANSPARTPPSRRGQHSRIKSAVRKGLAAGARVSASADSIGGRGQENVASGSESVSPTAMSASPPQMMSHDAQGMHMEGVEWERERSRERAGMEEAEVRMTMALSVSPPFGGIMNERERAMGCERGGPDRRDGRSSSLHTFLSLTSRIRGAPAVEATTSLSVPAFQSPIHISPLPSIALNRQFDLYPFLLARCFYFHGLPMTQL
ncbi:hypothetical protein B0H19DRAFT_1324913 [Mycena capillaripes]|nr:hypothetical protein B0H19DRAFT_1241696 [Mycena capillaripes]KAJ6533132.1 hypothetical protein B0H19DRAFT_1324913 [Mycena capillaripes]